MQPEGRPPLYSLQAESSEVILEEGSEDYEEYDVVDDNDDEEADEEDDEGDNEENDEEYDSGVSDESRTIVKSIRRRWSINIEWH